MESTTTHTLPRALRGEGPFATVDACIRVGQGLVLVRRRFPPLGWALPGGFVDPGESVEAACVREAAEETGLAIRLVTQLWTYSDPARDPRRHTLSVVFCATADGTPVGADDAAEARIFDRSHIPWSELVFDHARIVRDYWRWVDSGERPDVDSAS